MLGIQSFTKYGLMTDQGELLFYRVAPTNISVLSTANIDIKIRHLQMLLSAIPDLEFVCTDSCECFDENKAYLQSIAKKERNPNVWKLILKAREVTEMYQEDQPKFVIVAPPAIGPDI